VTAGARPAPAAATGGRLVVDALVAHGVDTVFGIPGTHNLEIYRALHGRGIRHVTPRHEQGAGYAADGYARTTGRPGVAIVTTGPALLNIAAAVGQAYSDSVPVLVVSPGMPTDHRRGSGLLHETRDQSAALAAVAGRSHRVASLAEIGPAIAGAFADLATDRPRPVHVEIPYDLLAAWAPSPAASPGRPDRAPVHRAPVVAARRPEPGLLDRATGALHGAARPLVVAGGGAKRAAAEVVALAERLGAPVLTTTNGKGTVPEDHPLAVTSALHLPAVAAMIAAADVVLAVGTELGPTDFWYGPPAFTGHLIRVDVDAAQLLTGPDPDTAIVGDAAVTVAEMLARLPARLPAVPSNDLVAAVRAQAAAEGERWLPWLSAIDAATRGRDVIVTADNAMACYYGALGNLAVRRPGGYCFPTGFGTLGYAVPAAIGAAVGNPGVTVVALSGDGGLMFSVQELATAAAEAISLPVVVFDNGGYGEIRTEMADAGIPALGVDLPTPDLAGLATALGGHGVTTATPGQLRTELAAALARPGPTVLVVPEPPPRSGRPA
jgi:thiamine pyrophosphate-dependent acetolactate synthase large subunit-like protein